MSKQHRPYLLSLTIRLLWAFSFHGWGKVWTGEKQLRRLSTAAALVPTHSYASANSRAYTDFPQNQSESQKVSSICGTSADCSLLEHQQTSIPCLSPVWLYAKQHKTEFTLNLLHLNQALSVCWHRARQAKVKLQNDDAVASHLHTVGEDERTARMCKHTQTDAQWRFFTVWHIMNRCSASSPCSSLAASC